MKQEALTSTRSVSQSSSHGKTRTVASLADAWIKTMKGLGEKNEQWSHPSRMRGLKYSFHVGDYIQFFVASLADAWIKIFQVLPGLMHISRRIPHGCVD